MYNCCTEGKLPDLSTHTSLEINAVYSFAVGEQTGCEALFGVASGQVSVETLLEQGFDKNELFYTVYSRDEDGYAEALHDEKSLDDIKLVASKIAELYPHLGILIN